VGALVAFEITLLMVIGNQELVDDMEEKYFTKRL
jgi:hypothetical protein